MNETLISALVRAQQQIDHVVKDEENPFFKSGYATLKNVFDTVKPALNAEGIYIQQISHESENGMCVETVFMGYGGSVSSGKVFIPAPKNDPQAFGSALSYCKRYSLMMAPKMRMMMLRKQCKELSQRLRLRNQSRRLTIC